MSLVVGGTLSALALLAGLAPAMVSALAEDRIVMRALGLTLGFAGYMLANVAIKAAVGPRRIFALVIAAPLFGLAVTLLAKPGLASYFHDTGRAVFIPWVFGVPAVLALVLSRWRVQ